MDVCDDTFLCSSTSVSAYFLAWNVYLPLGCTIEGQVCPSSKFISPLQSASTADTRHSQRRNTRRPKSTLHPKAWLWSSENVRYGAPGNPVLEKSFAMGLIYRRLNIMLHTLGESALVLGPSLLG